MSRASLDLCQTYLDLSTAKATAATAAAGTSPGVSPAAAGGGGGGGRDLAAARMHLRGVLKQCEGSFSSHGMYAEMQRLLDEVTSREGQGIPASKAGY